MWGEWVVVWWSVTARIRLSQMVCARLCTDMLMLRPGLLVELPSFTVSSCTLPEPPYRVDYGYFQLYEAGKLLICGGYRTELSEY